MTKNKYDYSKAEYINDYTRVKIFCNTCKRYFWQILKYNLSGCGCPYCSKSKGEYKIQYFLLENNIKYELQKRFNNCKDKMSLPFDFYLPELNVCIEYQGEQHYRSGFSFFKCKYRDKAEEAYRTLKLHDKIKKKYCKEHNIKLLEIKYYDNIEKKLNSIIKAIK